MPVGAILDVLVLALLGCALALGLRLNGRLKALRDGQADFARAVGELNEAARRAETGLAELRRGAEETLGRLQDGIATARGLVAELERAASRCPPVTRFAGDSPPPSVGGRDRATDSPPAQRSWGGGSARSVETGGQVSTAPPPPPPEGFADMIRRTLREAR